MVVPEIQRIRKEQTDLAVKIGDARAIVGTRLQLKRVRNRERVLSRRLRKLEQGAQAGANQRRSGRGRRP